MLQVVMRGYDRDEMYRDDYLDEYEEDGEEEEEEVEEEYEEEREDPKPTKEELEYLAIRQKLKEAARRKMKKESGVSLGNSQVKKNKLPYDNYGSFFGPSQPVIAQRVIQESKSLLENQHLAARISNSGDCSKKAPTSSETRPGVRIPPPKVTHEVQAKMKAQKLKDNRDYSFLLSEDTELPSRKTEPFPRKVSTPNKDSQSAQLQHKSRQLVSNHSKPSSNGAAERKHVQLNGKPRLQTARRPDIPSADSRRQLGRTPGNGPMAPKGLPSKMPAPNRAPVSNKSSPLTMNKRPSLVGMKKTGADIQKAPLPKMHSSKQKQFSEQRRVVGEQERPKMNPKASLVSSRPLSKPSKPIQPRAPVQMDRPKKRPSGPFPDQDEDDDPLAAIRKMFGYDPRRYADIDEDDSDMEANFDDIRKEELRSAKIAREEDEREARLIEEEERRERLRKEAKRRRKLSQ